MNTVDITVPDLPESVADATITMWHKKIGDIVKCDEVLVDIETDKVVLEIPASVDGILEKILEKKDSTVISRQIIGSIKVNTKHNLSISDTSQENSKITEKKLHCISDNIQKQIGPAMRRFLSQNHIEADLITEKDIKQNCFTEDMKKNTPIPINIEDEKILQKESQLPLHSSIAKQRNEKRIPMTRLRIRLIERLLQAKNTTAMLSTFNEVNMQYIITLRKKYGELFEQRHGIRLGFMSFYVKSVIDALKYYPEINASIDDVDIVYHNYFDISIAVSTPRGLVTPVLKNADLLSMSEIEKKIKEFALKGQSNKLTVEELTGGTFTITNGGVFGSLMSTPLINPPQSAILGIHYIKERPMAINGKMVILPMMYLVLSYDHRIIDGRESVGFLVKIKEFLEDPTRLFLDI
ncbi:dihydrolipoyllysine-residue succinyltransferase [Candidatus Erwinia haradaeae]|uniref:Dihydrolipoyllysine-residue succinyltransferase n=1 Tax=Candidatus Erwinia haradaeae TaxID=1922217 RepID=A0A451D3U9_9GAMM|nr:dihydrolipoyllysine-residue succinyltransferase [Candidatus Erwinia haradaeae]VFP80328.1 Dihydrolipoyllysine-residue succinyltransferase component of 2-oxoglutarate dehydrogenase complex [Candidatus Erwinia haradaeae]